MKTNDSNIRWVEPPKLGMLGKSYLMLFIKGLTTALRHLFFHKKITLQSPEQRHEIRDPVNYRGVHRLNKDEQGRVKCVACFLCATACPAHCIDIVAEPSPWPDREKYPKVFNIDELRCIYCGMCEQACPVEAIELTKLLRPDGVQPRGDDLRQGKVVERFRPDRGREPMPSQRGSHVAQDTLETYPARATQRPGGGDMSPSQAILTAGTLLTAVGIWLLLPGSSTRAPGTHGQRTLGGVLAVVGFGCLGSQVPDVGDWFTMGVFHAIAAATIVAAVATISFRSPVYCAIWFGMTLTGTAGLFLLAGAEFLAVATLVVYAGAILVTFLFVLMLSQPEGHTSYDRRSWEPMVSALIGAVLVAILTTMIGRAITEAEPFQASHAGPTLTSAAPYGISRLGADCSRVTWLPWKRQGPCCLRPW